jgi:hypothetical protein
MSLFSVFFFLLIGAASADPLAEGWQVSIQSEGIIVYIRPIPGSPLSEFMGVGDIDAPIEVVDEVYLDFPSYTEWYGMCKEFKLMKEFNDRPYHYYFYNVIKSPWPVTDRDSVLEVSCINQIASQGKVIININALKDASVVPVCGKYVRVTKLVGKTTLTRVNDKKTHIEMQFNSDPAGSVPPQLAKIFARYQPLKTIKGLREMVKKDIYYQKAGKTK